MYFTRPDITAYFPLDGQRTASPLHISLYRYRRFILIYALYSYFGRIRPLGLHFTHARASPHGFIWSARHTAARFAAPPAPDRRSPSDSLVSQSPPAPLLFYARDRTIFSATIISRHYIYLPPPVSHDTTPRRDIFRSRDKQRLIGSMAATDRYHAMHAPFISI